MDPTVSAPRKTSALVWVGRVISGVIVMMLLAGSYFNLSKAEFAAEGAAKMGFPENTLQPIGAALLVSALLFAIPQTAVLGAILLTGYFGGAVCTHVRAGEPFYLAVIFGALVWLALVFRDPRLRELLPLRSLPKQD
jgi:hypothetical protein